MANMLEIVLKRKCEELKNKRKYPDPHKDRYTRAMKDSEVSQQ